MQRCFFSGFVKRNFDLKLFMFLVSILLLTACGTDSTSPTITNSVNNTSNFVTRSCNQSDPVRTLQAVNNSAFVCRQNIKLSFDIHGNGIAVWEIEKESRIKLVYSLFNSNNKTWSKETEIAGVENVTDLTTFNHILASNGPGFSVRWEQSDETHNKEFFVATFSSTSLISIKRIESVDGYSVDLHRLIAQLKSEKQLNRSE